ncbi:MoxR family ATPase [Azospirillum cavernae]|uniref:MoxR family ATPase n=1 Tax=Azospirillum cavernae TaxID=2320860 RepID=A0A418W3F9_9PROT|nr:MoxR family ATPase [Azospirillum cavernae]RJF84563.1 MoxR family ATPase [Azospirillum cavernae]
MKFLTIAPKHAVSLTTPPGLPEQVHVFDQPSIDAINAAMAARRPLLVRGEPGIGKSQLARAAAKELGRVYVQHVVDARSEARDLLWRLDAVERLAEAQLAGALREDVQTVRNRLAIANHLRPGPLWWAFNWDDAMARAAGSGTPPPHRQNGDDPANGCVVLIDEIDKAEPEFPNGLLEALGSSVFAPPGLDAPVTVSGVAPLVIITSNEERALPDAFLRRCLVLCLELPTETAALIAHLVERGRAHFPAAADGLLLKAAEQLAADRARAVANHWSPLPGQAEYLDLIRAVLELARDDPERQEAVMDRIAGYVLKKHVGAV